MAKTPAEYQSLLQSLLPKGKLWNRLKTSRLGQLLLGMADELSLVDTRIDELFYDSFVENTDELLADYESEYSLPESGTQLGDTDSERRNDLYSKKLEVGQQYKQYFIDLAENLGREITIEEFRPFWAGIGAAGDSCGSQENIFFWKVWVEISVFTDVRITTLIMRFFRLKPAQSHLLFDFSGKAFTRGFSRGFESVNFYDATQYPGRFSQGFSPGFLRENFYDGINYIGGFSRGFTIGYNSYRGGGFTKGFNKSGFSVPN